MARHECGWCALWRELLEAYEEGRELEASGAAVYHAERDGIVEAGQACKTAVRVLARMRQEGAIL